MVAPVRSVRYLRYRPAQDLPPGHRQKVIHRPNGDNRFSVRLINGDDNETGGRRLDQIYTLNRILDGDAFYMKITN